MKIKIIDLFWVLQTNSKYLYLWVLWHETCFLSKLVIKILYAKIKYSEMNNLTKQEPQIDVIT